jgi:tetratricopeptide (TPR) repeat protein
MIPIFSIAERYHRRALVRAQQLKDPVSIGHAYLFLAHHEHYRGMWTVALDHFGQAAASYRKAGHLRGWGVAYGLSTMLLGLRGNLANAIEQSNEMIRVGEDAADSQLLAWGLGHLGTFIFYCGATLEEACAHIERALEIAKALPDYVTVAATNAGLAWFHLRHGKLPLAMPFLRESMRLFSEKRLKNPFTEWSQLNNAEVLLAEAEFASGAVRETRLSEASQLIKGILNRSRAVTAFKTNAFRLQGIYEWLNGNHVKARKCWRQSLKVAVELGATYDLARTHFEIGRRTGEFEHLKNAEAIFAAIGANLDLQQTRALMEVQVGKTIVL